MGSLLDPCDPVSWLVESSIGVELLCRDRFLARADALLERLDTGVMASLDWAPQFLHLERHRILTGYDGSHNRRFGHGPESSFCIAGQFGCRTWRPTHIVRRAGSRCLWTGLTFLDAMEVSRSKARKTRPVLSIRQGGNAAGPQLRVEHPYWTFVTRGCGAYRLKLSHRK
jgi:hypothetical protein